jgi:hypothetical protein
MPEVTARTERRIEGVRTHRCRFLNAEEILRVHGIPVTTVPRTLVDIASELSLDALARACHEAGVRYRTTPAQVVAELERPAAIDPVAAGTAIRYGEVEAFRAEELEGPALECTEGDVDVPVDDPAQRPRVPGARNRPEHRLTVELDSYRFHNSRYSWEQDHRQQSWIDHLYGGQVRIVSAGSPPPPPRCRSGAACGAGRRGGRV